MNKLIFGMVMVAMLVAFSAPASALTEKVAIDSLYRYEEVVPSGSYWLDWDKIGATTVNFDVPPGDLYKVRIYNSAWMPSTHITATYPDGSTPLPDRYYLVDNYTRYTGCGTCGVWYPNDTVRDVTNPGAINTYSTSDSGHGTAMLILYENTDNPNPLYSWLYQGYDDVDEGQDEVCYTFNNVPAGSATHWTLMLAVTCADDGAMTFNGHTLPGSGFNSDTKWYHVATHDVSNIIETGDNIVGFDAVSDDYTHPYWMWLVGTTPEEKPDLTIPNNGIVIGTPRPNNNFQVDATILNQGEADAVETFSVKLYANDIEKGSTTVSGLAKDAPHPVSFNNVNLPEGCYEFKVVVDVNDDVDESDEYNNERTDYGQVGYVIVVESDSDFDALVLEAGNGMPSGSVMHDIPNDTYYIQDLTITNCAGDGIHITGTTKNFVIKNCTIENCAPDASGVFLNDVTKGTITECTLQNNEAYGVELGLVPLDSEDPKFINITFNTIYQNGMSTNKNGIDLIGTDCIVKNNIVRDNGEYGIYMYGNDNKLCNNIIENNDNYGMKVYDSTGNHIYWNKFTNNGGVSSQGYDNMAATNTWNQVNKDYPYYTIYTGCTGNYWDDHPAPYDAGPDGIVDTSYVLDGGAGVLDSYPLVTLPWRFNITIEEGLNYFGIPLYQDDTTLNAVFDNHPGNLDKVRKFVSGEGWKTATFWNGNWVGDVAGVEPMEPEVGYAYERQSGDFTFVLIGTRLCPSWVFTPIYPGYNLISYISFTPTGLSTFGSNPENMDKVRRFVPGEGFKTATSWNDNWVGDVAGVEPIEVPVAYEYDRQASLYWWIYEA